VIVGWVSFEEEFICDVVWVIIVSLVIVDVLCECYDLVM